MSYLSHSFLYFVKGVIVQYRRLYVNIGGRSSDSARLRNNYKVNYILEHLLTSFISLKGFLVHEYVLFVDAKPSYTVRRTFVASDGWNRLRSNIY